MARVSREQIERTLEVVRSAFPGEEITSDELPILLSNLGFTYKGAENYFSNLGAVAALAEIAPPPRPNPDTSLMSTHITHGRLLEPLTREVEEEALNRIK